MGIVMIKVEFLVLAVLVFVVTAAAAAAGTGNGGPEVFLAKLMHRFSEEMNAVRVSRLGGEVNDVGSPRKWSSEYYRRLLSSDLERQKVKMGPQSQYLYPSQGNNVRQLGNELGWLHYAWMDVGSPNVSFLIALDTGSDLFWVPCGCIQCAPLSASYYTSLDKDLNEYNPSGSTTSKFINCSHHLCELGSKCRSPNQPCPYTVNYETEGTSTSGVLVEDILHLASVSSYKSNKFLRAPVAIGCGSKQTGAYLQDTAPDGVMGLGLGNISVPRFLAKAGLVRNSFSLCFDENDDGRIYFGDQGIASQNTTPFLASDEQKYIIGVKGCCVGTTCLEQTDFNVLVDSGTSFTYIPRNAYEKLVAEFDRQLNATKTTFQDYPFEDCYNSSYLAAAKITWSLKFDSNNSFVVLNPLIQGPNGFCLAVNPIEDKIGTIGQNFMTGYKMVFDGENMKLGWSHSECPDLADVETPPATPSNDSSPGTLPTIQEQSPPNHTPPAVSVNPSMGTSIFMKRKKSCFIEFLFPFWLIACMFLWIF